MTKKEMAARIEELENQLGIVTKPTKMQEIEALEAETMVSVKDIVAACEKVTGRKLVCSHKEPETASLLIKIGESNQPLRDMVYELTSLGMDSGKYDFYSYEAFASWVYSRIMKLEDC